MGYGFLLQRLIKTVCNELLLCYFVSADVAHKGVKMKLIDIASKVTSWNGEGLPPIGCEFLYGCQSKAKCLAIGHHMLFASKGDPDDEESEYEEFMISIQDSKFHAINVEAERKRESIIHALDNILGQALDQDASLPVEIYKAIAAGNIRGLKLED